LLFRRRQGISSIVKPVEHSNDLPVYDWSGRGVDGMFNFETAKALGLNVPTSLP